MQPCQENPNAGDGEDGGECMAMSPPHATAVRAPGRATVRDGAAVQEWTMGARRRPGSVREREVAYPAVELLRPPRSLSHAHRAVPLPRRLALHPLPTVLTATQLGRANCIRAPPAHLRCCFILPLPHHHPQRNGPTPPPSPLHFPFL
ncbi:hypothetical protein BLX87_03445, partial [Bacillus sp. VT-16-64]